MKRLFDLVLVIILWTIFFIPFLIIWIIVRISSPGPALYWSKRVGKNNEIFMMPKFRSMRIDTPQVATHLLDKSENYLTPVGRFIRKTSLDEIPQLYSILKGDMSFVGPRPALYNQDDLIELRTQKGIHKLIPGLTGWAQINGRDEIPIPKKVEFDYEYLKRRGPVFDLKILFLTGYKVAFGKDISH